MMICPFEPTGHQPSFGATLDQELIAEPAYTNIASGHSVSTTAGVPKPIVDKLASEIGAVMSAPKAQKLLLSEGALPQISPPPEEFKKFVDAEITRWRELVEKAGILHSQ
jgi:tripartite-type tricarboxylate transporter receptor subunit TctC